MKLRSLLFPTLLFSASCAAPMVEEDADCCAEEATTMQAAEAALPGSSLYLLDGTWTDQAGTTRMLQDFEGEIVVAAMVFTNCKYACPLIVSDLKDIEAEIPEALLPQVRWLLVSMDSARDTPEVLAAYAENNHIDTARWTLLHGEDYPVRGIAAALGINYMMDARGNFSHSNKITVLNRSGSIHYQLEGLNADNADCVEAILAAVAQG